MHFMNTETTSISAPASLELDVAAARLRSGAAARLAGVPVSTLRVWERRYSVVAAPKTATGQRLYSMHDVQRLRLLRLLTGLGHGIGTIAALDLPALQQMAGDATPAAARPRQLTVVGRAAAPRLLAAAGCTLQAVYDDLDEAERQAEKQVERAVDAHGAASGASDVLLVHLPSLQPATATRVLALRQRLRPQFTVVVYAFGAEHVTESLRAAGVRVCREPASGRELAHLIGAPPQATTAIAPPAHDSAGAQPPATVAPRRFSDEALVRLAELPSAVACECPRHLSEIVLQLAGFERYSAECTSRSPADAVLHRELGQLAGRARAMFEQALERVAAHEGLDLSATSPDGAAR
jgi:MerR family transcriptional regulator, light-induced transcriptional regulator